MPSPGLIRGLRPASGPGVRDDGGVSAGYAVPVFYDSMIAKLVVWGGSRAEAIARMARALREYQVLGIRTTIPFFLWLMRQPDYLAGRYDTTYLDRLLEERPGETFSELTAGEEELAAIAIGASTRTCAPAPGRRWPARRASGSRPRGARRCADDVRDRDQRSARTVSVERTGGRFRVIVDGRPHDVDAVRGDTFGLSLLLDGDAGISREVQIAPAGDGSSGQLLVRIDGRVVAATVNGRRTRRGGAHAGAATTASRRSPPRCRAASFACSWPPGTRSARGRQSSSSKR